MGGQAGGGWYGLSAAEGADCGGVGVLGWLGEGLCGVRGADSGMGGGPEGTWMEVVGDCGVRGLGGGVHLQNVQQFGTGLNEVSLM